MFLPRDIGSRIGMGCLAAFFAWLWGYATYKLFTTPFPQLGFWGTALLEIARDLLLTATLFLVLIVVWCIAMPRWVEQIFRVVLAKLFWVINLSALTIGVFAVCHAIWQMRMN